MSLKTSSDSGPEYPVAHTARGNPAQVEPALQREQPVVAAPLQHVHGQPRRIGELEEEDAVAGIDAMSPWSGPRERMWKLSRQRPT